MFDGNWPLSLALDGDQAFEAVLSDIPLFCIGLMAMGFVTFIFALKRMNSTALYLCSASLLLFIAAILDLGQLLIREPERNFDERVVFGFIVVREVGLGLSYGFLFLFVWRVVAECPYDERSRLLTRPIKSSAFQPHSASWTRWGPLGTVLKWFTLTLVIVIPLLQILWRLIRAQRQYGSIYIADSTLEIVASAIFVLKVILNVLVSPSMSWWTPFRYYLGLILGLIITGAVGVGNLISFVFSETVPGRFLRAIGIYILLLWNLITIFHRRSISRQPLDDQEVPSIQQESSGGQIANMSPHPREGTASIVALARVAQNPAENGLRPLRISAASRLSVMVNRVEQNGTLADITRTISSRSSRKSPVTRPRKPELQFDIITPTLPSTAEDPNEEPPTTGISFSYYMMNTGVPDAPIIREPPVNPSKPSIYQVDKQEEVGYTSSTSLVAQPPSQSASLSSLGEFMRERNEIDQSIAKLKLLSQDSVRLSPFDSTLVPAPESPSLAGDTAMSAKSRPQSTLVTESLSPHSEFSFSAFPIPPSLGSEGVRASRFTVPAIRKLPQPPDQASNQAVPVLPVSESTSQMSTVVRMTSEGTQYDVTSFIGNLTEAETPVNDSSMSEAPTQELRRTVDGDQGQVEQELPLSSSVASDSSSLNHLKPMLLPVVASGRKAVALSSLRPIHAAPRPSQLGRRDSNVILKPFLLGTSATSVPPSLPSSTMVPLGSRRGSRAVRVPTHKSRISTPRMNFSDVLVEEAPEMYERPRPPPVFIGLSDRPKA